jgi:hypothetical protein
LISILFRRIFNARGSAEAGNLDAELELFRTQVNCAAVMENLGQPWRLKKGSSRRALKYRRTEGEI